MKNETLAFIYSGRQQRRRRFAAVTILLGLLTAGLCCAMLLLGNTLYPVATVIEALRGETIKGATFAVKTIRLPRMCAGLFAGFSFGIAGSVFQTMLRNPLANPNIIGITSGSSAGAVFCIVLLHTNAATVYFASIASGLAAALVMFLLVNGGKFSNARLILVGIGVQAMLSAVVNYVLLKGSERDIPTAMRWLSGSLNGTWMTELYPLFIGVWTLTPVVLIYTKRLSMLELGEEAAATMGVNTSKTRAALMIGAVLLSSMATAATGPIAFVSFLAGPIAKRLVGYGNTNPLPAGLFGAALTLAADLLGQFAFETRFPVGVITGLLGAPYLILLLIRMNRTGAF
ncbi:MAG: iron chelate uptake ABC transporter family permease subunit [Oscillospiraceae bacterium]|jgi:iron complex transport system permease protein|nr:iron chelate uptake ABC transporter family permease subunit [Oscillospiraceae bacterium]